MNNQVTINKENILNAYKQATEEQKELLRNMFGKDIFQPKDIRDRIKTLGDAVIILGNNNKSVIDFNEIFNSACSKDIIAFSKLKIIVEALNEGWKPTFDEKEYRYYPSFYIYSRNEYDELNENQKKELIVVGKSKNNLNVNSSNIYALEVTAASFSVTSGYHLALQTQELAVYCGKQFIDIWADFLLA